MPRLLTRRCLVLTVVLSTFLFFGLTVRETIQDLMQSTAFNPNILHQSHLRRTTNDNKGDADSTESENDEPEDTEAKPWFMSGGTKWPKPASINLKTGRRDAKLWPQEDRNSDRIPEQLMFLPPKRQETANLKKILLYNGIGSWAPHKTGRAAFSRCPVSKCILTVNKAESLSADAILYKDHFIHPGHHKPSKQVWILYLLECPYHTLHQKYNDVFNWTATYRHDSDIVTPYERWVEYEGVRNKPLEPMKNYAANKTKHVAWFVSNCGARNKRLQYAFNLQMYIPVDIFGSCGSKRCNRSNKEKCFQMLDNEYKFYLAFENSNCKDYITEKFFVNGLQRDILPIVMGARPEDYEKAGPPHSYIHVDDFPSVKALAQYLHKLDADDDLYNSYFRWKGTGEFINTHFFCRLCALLHDDFPAKSYRDINEWWRGQGICTTGSWRRKNNIGS